jgi:hypothetical protein
LIARFIGGPFDGKELTLGGVLPSELWVAENGIPSVRAVKAPLRPSDVVYIRERPIMDGFRYVYKGLKL